MTRMRFFTVTAVGRFTLLSDRLGVVGLRERKAGGGGRCGKLYLVKAETLDESGRMVVPVPRGLVTFRIRIGMLARITCSMVNGWMTSDP